MFPEHITLSLRSGALRLGGGLLAIALSTSLAAQDTGESKSDSSADSASPVDTVGESWIQQFQGQGDADPGERIGPVNSNPGANGESRFANPGSGDSDAVGSAAAEPAPATADSATSPSIIPRDEGPSLFSVIFRFFALMLVMIGLFYMGMRYLRNKSGVPAMGGGDLVQVLVSTPLVQGKFLQIVDVAGRLMVLGVSESGVQMLETIDDGVVADRIRIWQSRRAANATVPGGLLEQIQRQLGQTDFRFWAGGAESGGSSRSRHAQNAPGFRELLSAQIPARGGRTAPADEPAADLADAAKPAPAQPARKAATRKQSAAKSSSKKAAKGSRKSNAASAESEVTNAASASRDYARQDFANDLFSEEDGAPVSDEIALKNLLKRQKQRLAAIREQPGEL